jgi:oxepin-CoA hydrolase/3-oxo-5,6-dehydrosuberyl-CoA semialdehyde dehydrogenase
MQTLNSYLQDQWVSGTGDARTIVDATTGETVATASTAGLDLGAAMAFGRRVGGPGLRQMTFAERGRMLKSMAGVIHEHREALIDVSRQGGTTRGDAKFDIDGASGTLSFYAYLSKGLGAATYRLDGERESVLGSKRFVAQHVLVPRHGVAVHINAFNFPAWGMAEKAACALLAGMPVVSKPGTATSPLTVRIVELWVEAGILPSGSLQLVAGSVGDLLDHVGPQDCVAFTGGSDTARRIRGHDAVIRHNVRLNIEADSLNMAILGPDVGVGEDTWWMFINDMARDLTQKSGQKCTCVRRIAVPENVSDAVIEALGEKLAMSVVGLPGDKGTGIGPVSSPGQRDSVEAGLKALGEHCRVVWQAESIPEGGCFVRPTLFRSDAGIDTPYVHEHEVFGPVATVLPYSGDSDEVVAMAAAGGGGLVASVYSDDKAFGGATVLGLAPWHGRVMWGSRKIAGQSPGPGTVLPNLVHGGPGKAGGGEELGGLRGLDFYSQRTAIQGDRGLLDKTL